jgi:hypothetical protein
MEGVPEPAQKATHGLEWHPERLPLGFQELSLGKPWQGKGPWNWDFQDGPVL